MKLPLQITTRKLSLSDFAEDAIKQKAHKLEQFYDHIIGCRVMVETPHRHKHQGTMYNVRIDLTVPGNELVVKREPHEDIYVAIRDAFDAARRQLQSHARRRRGAVKTHHNGQSSSPAMATAEAPQYGRVSKLFVDEGFGYLETGDGRELYFSTQSMLDGDLRALEVGTPLLFVEQPEGDGASVSEIRVQ